MMLAYYVHDLSPFLIHFGAFGLRWYGLAYLAGFVAGILLYRNLARRGFSDLKPGEETKVIEELIKRNKARKRRRMIRIVLLLVVVVVFVVVLHLKSVI